MLSHQYDNTVNRCSGRVNFSLRMKLKDAVVNMPGTFEAGQQDIVSAEKV